MSNKNEEKQLEIEFTIAFNINFIYTIHANPRIIRYILSSVEFFPYFIFRKKWTIKMNDRSIFVKYLKTFEIKKFSIYYSIYLYLL